MFTRPPCFQWGWNGEPVTDVDRRGGAKEGVFDHKSHKNLRRKLRKKEGVLAQELWGDASYDWLDDPDVIEIENSIADEAVRFALDETESGKKRRDNWASHIRILAHEKFDQLATERRSDPFQYARPSRRRVW